MSTTRRTILAGIVAASLPRAVSAQAPRRNEMRRLGVLTLGVTVPPGLLATADEVIE